MRLVDRIVERYRAGYWEGSASGAAIYSGSIGSGGRREGPMPNLDSEALRVYQSNGIVWAVVLARLSLFTEALFCFQTGDDKKTYRNPSLKLLRHPWPNGSTGDLLARMEQDVSLWGNFFGWHYEDRLVRFRPTEITIISELVDDTYREVIGYDWDPAPSFDGSRSTQAQFFPVDEVCHYAPYPDPNAAFRGMSWLTPVIREVTGDDKMTNYKIQYLENAAVPNLLVKYNTRLRPDTIEAIVNRMQSKYAGDNAYRTLVLDQGADATVVGSNLDQMGFTDIQNASAERICAAGGVPMSVCGLGSGGRGSSYATDIRRFGDFTMRPLWRNACAALEKMTAPDSDDDRLWYDVNDVAALRASETERAQTIQIRSAALLTLTQGGFERQSSVDAVVADDLTMLKPDPKAPPPGGPPAAPAAAAGAAGGKAGTGDSGSNPQVGPRQSRPQTPATKAPAPNTFASSHPPTANANANGSK